MTRRLIRNYEMILDRTSKVFMEPETDLRLDIPTERGPGAKFHLEGAVRPLQTERGPGAKFHLGGAVSKSTWRNVFVKFH